MGLGGTDREGTSLAKMLPRLDQDADPAAIHEREFGQIELDGSRLLKERSDLRRRQVGGGKIELTDQSRAAGLDIDDDVKGLLIHRRNLPGT